MSSTSLEVKRRGRPMTGTAKRLKAIPARLSSVPTPPAVFDEERCRIWTQVCEHLISADALTAGDLVCIEDYCNQTAELREITAQLIAVGHLRTNTQGNLVTHPLLTVRSHLARAVQSMGSTLGLNPKSRGDLDVNKEDAKAEALTIEHPTSTEAF